jgi:hypothetical protein
MRHIVYTIKREAKIGSVDGAYWISNLSENLCGSPSLLMAVFVRVNKISIIVQHA